MLNLYLLCKNLGIRPAHIVEVGAGEPELCQIKGFLENRWFDQATLIEPMPGYAERIREVYGGIPGVRVLQVAITDVHSMVALYDQGRFTFVGSLPTSPALANGYAPNDRNKVFVEGHTFDTLDPGDIDVLAVDAEGSEWWVISHMRSRPRLIVCETHLAFHAYENPWLAAIKSWMAENGYQEVTQTISDTVWIRGAA